MGNAKNCKTCSYRLKNLIMLWGHTDCSVHRKCSTDSGWRPDGCDVCLKMRHNMVTLSQEKQLDSLHVLLEILKTTQNKVKTTSPEMVWDFEHAILHFFHKFKNINVTKELCKYSDPRIFSRGSQTPESSRSQSTPRESESEASDSGPPSTIMSPLAPGSALHKSVLESVANNSNQLQSQIQLHTQGSCTPNTCIKTTKIHNIKTKQLNPLAGM